MIEKTWMGASKSNIHKVHCIDVDQAKLPEYLQLLMQADQIVLTCFTFKLIQIAQFLRRDFRPDLRFIIYVHNQASIAFWPFRSLGLGDLLRTDDVFIVSCSLDLELVKKTSENLRVELLPFTLDRLGLSNMAASSKRTPKKFVFIGRLSPQKNLHSLIYAFSILKVQQPESDVTLELYGREDDLGSPNMGLEFPHYLRYLQTLSNELNISDSVLFKGHVDRGILEQSLSGSGTVFVSPSLHSDENFGMAAFSALLHGRVALLSHWGGHVDFAKHFPDQVHFVNVHSSEAGPFIDIVELVKEMSNLLGADPVLQSKKMPLYYQEYSISERLLKLALEPKFQGEALQFTMLADQVWQAQKKFQGKSVRQCMIFADYSDQRAHEFFRGYGMGRNSESYTSEQISQVKFVPWAKLQELGLLVEDPHRGRFEVSPHRNLNHRALLLGVAHR